MGLFADKIETVVSSTVYNLAGDESSQPDLLKTAIVGNALTGRDNLASVIQNTVAQGPANNQKRFLRYMANTNPTYLIEGAVNSYADVNAAGIQTPVSELIGLTGSQTLRIAAAKIDVGEVDYWAEQWVGKNHPQLTREAWFAEFDDLTNEIVIFLPEDVSVRLPAPADFLWATETQTGAELRKLLYVVYSVVEPGDDTEQATESFAELLVYRMGTGNLALDGLLSSSQPMTEFFPALPLRLRNRSIRHTDYTAEYDISKKAYRKLTGRKVDDLLDSIEENEDIDDIDYAYLIHGVPLNTENTVAKEYLYKFLSQLMETQNYDREAYDSYKDRVIAAERSRIEWERYLQRQENGGYFTSEEPPVEPQEVATVPPLNTFEIFAPALENFRQRLSWNFMKESQRIGNCNRFDGDANRTKAKQGEYFFHVGTDYEFQTRYRYETNNDSSVRYRWRIEKIPRIFLFHQTSEFTYTQLEIVGFKYENFVYQTETVAIGAKDALEDIDPSGFVIPLHAPTLNEMGMAKANRMSGSSLHIVFNSYDRVRKKWYQSSIFQIVLIGVVAALSVLIPGAGGLVGSGILGSNIAVGAAIGMTTVLSAAIAGAITNAFAAALITSMIASGSSALFGEKVGAVIGTLTAFFVMSGSFSTGSFELDWSQMMSADNILRLTTTGSNALAGFIRADTMETYEEMGELGEEYSEEMSDIQALMRDVLGGVGVELDPMEMTDVLYDFNESRESFLSRTLLTGTDVVRISHNMISEFPRVTLELPKAFV